MRLKRIILENFRGYQGRHSISIENLTGIIGKNDAGKSTIFDALEIFFNDGKPKIEVGDVNVFARNAGNCKVVIGCVFEESSVPLVLDATAETTLKDEYLLNKEGEVELHHVVDFSDGKVKARSIFIHAWHPTNAGIAELHSLTNSKLRALAKELDISEKVNQNSNVELRAAIWKATPNLECSVMEIEIGKSNTKDIWEQLKKRLPRLAIFRADRTSTDDDSEVQDPLKIAVQQALETVKDELDAITNTVITHTTQVAEATIAKLHDFDPQLASKLDPDMKTEPKWENLFKLSLTSDDGIPVNNRGSGVRRLVLFSFFRAEVERQRLDEENGTRNVIYAIEEPETAQHPDNQRLIIETLRGLADTDGNQVLLTTHVPGIAGLLPLKAIRYISLSSDGSRTIEEGNATIGMRISDDLGILPDKRVQVLVCLEGPTDVAFLTAVSELLHADSRYREEVVNLRSDPRVAVIPLGGSTLRQAVDQEYFQKFHLPEVHIYDRDCAPNETPKYQQEADMVNARSNGSIAFITSKRELENYMHEDPVNQVLAHYKMGPAPLKIDDVCDVEQELKKHLGQGKIARRSIKTILSEDVPQFTTVQHFEARNGLSEILGWLRIIKVLADRLESG